MHSLSPRTGPRGLRDRGIAAASASTNPEPPRASIGPPPAPNTGGTACMATRTSGSQWLSDAEQVAFAVAKPRCAFALAALTGVVALDLGHTSDGSQARTVDVLEHHATPLGLAHH